MASSVVLRQDSARLQETADSQLCRSCRLILFSGEKIFTLRRFLMLLFLWLNFGSGRSIRVLVDNAKKGCVVCNLFLESLSEQERLFLARSRHTGSLKGYMVSNGERIFEDVVLSYPICKKDLQHTTLKKISLSIAKYENIGQESVTISPPFGQGSYHDMWSTAKRWLHECTEGEDHEICKVQVTPSKLPTRLVFISKDSKDVRLCLTGKLEQKQRIEYLTLSHCWGKTPMPLVATRANLESLLTTIPYGCLTKTFQDALRATQLLGFEYIWIDSLCILQDDEQDWLLEASRMSDVYSGCTINLVAADGPDGSSGCYFERGAKIIPTDVSYAGQHTQYSPNLQTYLSRIAAVSRSWCFQELLLSPRSLYFCKSQLFWKCLTIRAHEWLSITRPFYPRLLSLRACVVKGGGHIKDQEIATLWLTLLVPYSKTAVTFPKDKVFSRSPELLDYSTRK
ncbi:heterokaryon incompatibility protein-domain-containing protein [Nemania sp. FL0916]|nr:heterokaryon incompatibility protein-domain-containing protein [Nemania sp. FL0916]